MDREAQIKALKSTHFDILVIGGGATGSGIALDAVSRGLKVALVERGDFACGTSSRSTKLIHGGVRYLEQAVLKFDRSQFNLVRDALHERSTLLKIAPHLASPLAILTPLYNRMEVPYYRSGLRLYDRLAGKATLHKSFFVGPREALQKFPMLKPDRLRGGVVYFDGQFDDARMNVCIALTAAEQGGTVANYVDVTGLLQAKGKISGATVKDAVSGESWDVHAKVVVNAAGPYLDVIRNYEDPKFPKILNASSGAHIVLSRAFSPPKTGLLIPKTEDGRVLFLLPWLGHTLVGTTDNPAPIEPRPRPTMADVDYILRQLKRYFALAVDHTHVLSAWTGLRPLVNDPRASDTARLSRDHIVQVSPAGLVTIAGGKWTTYRKMALDTVDQAILVGHLKGAHESRTEKIFLSGGEGYLPDLAAKLARKHMISPDVAEHLARSYGSRAEKVLAFETGHPRTLIEGHPYLESEVTYATRVESARHIGDILCRRTRLAFLDSKAAQKAVPLTASLMAKVLGWDAGKTEKEVGLAREELKSFELA